MYKKSPTGQRPAFGRGAQKAQTRVGIEPRTQGQVLEGLGYAANLATLAIINPRAAKKVIDKKNITKQVANSLLQKGKEQIEEHTGLKGLVIDYDKIGMEYRKGGWSGSATIDRKGEPQFRIGYTARFNRGGKVKSYANPSRKPKV